jgi:CTP synthase
MPRLAAAGLRVTGLSPDGRFVEMVEHVGHPWFVACQFHPEYKSRPLSPHPLFREFVAAAYRHRRSRARVGQLDSSDAYAAN